MGLIGVMLILAGVVYWLWCLYHQSPDEYKKIKKEMEIEECLRLRNAKKK